MKLNRIIPLLFCVFVIVQISTAQKGYEVGGWLGIANYYGDLNTTLNLRKPGPAGGIVGRYNFNTRVAARTSLNVGRLGADDALSQNNFERNRNLSFTSLIFDWSNVLEFNFFNYVHGSKKENFTPFFMAGFNVVHFNPTAVFEDTRYKLRPLGTEGQNPGSEYSLFSGGILLGGGFKIDVNRDFSINIEISTRLLFTDYLDDVSSVFPDKTLLLTNRGEIAVALSDRSLADGLGEQGRQRGDTKGKDKYAFFGVSVMRYFGGIECPAISRPRLKY
ncbi:MAG: hypothetical protein IPM42_07510 [Saprospiraceae bacterium]|nr:hypothetical protein [Saprospiraceae bacterium]